MLAGEEWGLGGVRSLVLWGAPLLMPVEVLPEIIRLLQQPAEPIADPCRSLQ